MVHCGRKQMHQFDTVLKDVVLASATSLPGRLTGSNVAEWLNVEMPKVQANRLDLVGWLEDRRLFHAELQSTNDSEMIYRMLEAAQYLGRHYGVLPVQAVVYVGDERMRMMDRLRSEQLRYRIRMVDMRSYWSRDLLASPLWGDQLLAILAKHGDRRETVRAILKKITEMPKARRADALAKLMVLAGLRKAEPIVKEESKQVPVHIDPMENSILREWYYEAKAEGSRHSVTHLLAKRFGRLPRWAQAKIEEMTAEELDEALVRILDARSLEEVLGR